MPFLNLPGWKTLANPHTSTDYQVSAVYTVPPDKCPKCGNTKGIYGHGRRKQHVVDIPSHGKRVAITLDRTRHRCGACKATFLQPVEGLNETGTMTTRLMRYIAKQSLSKTFTSIADEVGVTEGTVRNIFNQYVEYLDQRVKFRTPRVLGIDEVHLLDGIRCVFVNVEAGNLIGMLPNRKKPDVVAWLKALPNKENLYVVTMDMWVGYRAAVRETLPFAKIVIDRFHVIKLASEAVEAVRRGLRDGMNTYIRRQMMRSRYLLLRRANQLTEQDVATLEDWLVKFPQLAHAYIAKESFMNLWELQTRAEAEEGYREWCNLLNLSVTNHFKPLMTAMENWRTEIFNYWDHRYTNATTEAVNGLIKIANRSGRGYSFNVLKAKVLYGRPIIKVPFGHPVEVGFVGPLPNEITFTIPKHDTTGGKHMQQVLEMLREISRKLGHPTRK